MQWRHVTIQEQFGQIDIYVFDQILRGNIAAGMKVLDAGCGYGRNLVYLLREGCEVYALDANPEGVEHVRALAAELNPKLPAENFQVGQIEAMPFADGFADVVMCNSVLHFARDEHQFLSDGRGVVAGAAAGRAAVLRGMGSRIGMDFEQVRPDIYRIGDGQEWFLVDEELLLGLTSELNGVMVDPLKTTIVQDYRCMTTWVVRKRTLSAEANLKD